VAQRRAQVARLIESGYSYRTIAAHLKVSLATVAQDKAAVIAEWREKHLESIGEGCVTDLSRLDNVIQRLVVRIEQDDDPRHVMAFVAVLKRRADILGYDAADRARSGLRIEPLESAIEIDSNELLTPDGRPVANRLAARIHAAFANPVSPDGVSKGPQPEPHGEGP
jgi:transposase